MFLFPSTDGRLDATLLQRWCVFVGGWSFAVKPCFKYSQLNSAISRSRTSNRWTSPHTLGKSPTGGGRRWFHGAGSCSRYAGVAPFGTRTGLRHGKSSFDSGIHEYRGQPVSCKPLVGNSRSYDVNSVHIVFICCTSRLRKYGHNPGIVRAWKFVEVGRGRGYRGHFTHLTRYSIR